MVTTMRDRPGDIVLHLESFSYCTKNAIIRNATGASVTITDPAGVFVKAGDNGADFNLAKSTEEADVVGIILRCDDPPETIANSANSVKRYLVLHKAPCVVNKDNLPTSDLAGVAYDTFAQIITALEALGFKFVTNPTKTTSQTT